MQSKSRIHIISADDLSHAEIKKTCEELMAAITARGYTGSASFKLQHIILIVHGPNLSAEINQVLDAMDLTSIDTWLSGAPFGNTLVVNFRYTDDDQLSSSLINEGLLAYALADISGGQLNHRYEDRKKAAITAFVDMIDWECGADVIGGSMEVEDILTSVTHWNELEVADIALWNPAEWAYDEPMLDIGFTAQAENDSGHRFDIRIPGVANGWQIPLRLAPKDIDPEDQDMLRDLVRLAHAPEEIQNASKVLPYRITIRNPSILPHLA